MSVLVLLYKLQKCWFILVISCQDYCNCLSIKLTKKHINGLQSVMNYADRIVFSRPSDTRSICHERAALAPSALPSYIRGFPSNTQGFERYTSWISTWYVTNLHTRTRTPFIGSVPVTGAPNQSELWQTCLSERLAKSVELVASTY